MKGIIGVGKLLLLMVVLIAVYVLCLYTAYLIPDAMISGRVNHEIKVLNDLESGKIRNIYPKLGLGPRTQLDLFTDRVMLQQTIQKADSVLAKAMIPNYARYWHGYQIILRPLMLFTSRRGICLLFGALIAALAWVAVSTVGKGIGADGALVFAFSLAMSYCWSAPLSMQYMNVYILSFLGIFLCRFVKSTAVLFTVLGSLVNFFDFLTFPLLTLLFPLTFLLLLQIQREDYSLKSGVSFWAEATFCWGCGYGLTWVAKWSIGSLVLGQSVLRSALNASIFRIAGNAAYPVSHYKAIQRNLRALLLNIAPEGWLIAFVICVLYLEHRNLVPNNWYGEFLARLKARKDKIMPLFLTAMIPYIWYFILANHSQIHYWFTFRNQAGTIFALGGAALILCDDLGGSRLKEHVKVHWKGMSALRKTLSLIVIAFLLWC